MSKRCKLQKEYYKEFGNYKGSGKYTDHYVDWLESKVLAINYTRCCETLNTKDRIAFHVFAEINKYAKCFEGYKRDGKTFSETEVLKRYNTYLQSL